MPYAKSVYQRQPIRKFRIEIPISSSLTSSNIHGCPQNRTQHILLYPRLKTATDLELVVPIVDNLLRINSHLGVDRPVWLESH